MKLNKLILAALVLGLAGCANTSTIEPVNCVGLVEDNKADTVNPVNLHARKAVNGGHAYKLAGGSDTAWMHEKTFVVIDCYE